MNLFDQQVTLSVNSVVLLIAAIAFITLLGVVTYLVINNRRQKNLLKPKYGFLGKSLYALLTVAVLGGGLVIGILSVNRGDNVIDVEAKKTVNADIYFNTLLKEPGFTYVDFKAVPTVEGKVYGNPNDDFIIYWTFSGTNNNAEYSYTEQSRNSANRSGLQKYFKNGTYHTTVNIVFQDSTYTFTKEVTF